MNHLCVFAGNSQTHKNKQATRITSDISLQPSDIVSMMDLNKIQSALLSLKEERAHIEDYFQNAAAKKKELEKKLNTSFKYNYQ